MFSDLYDKKYLFKCLLWLGIVFGLMRVTGGAGFAIVIPIVLYCALARRTEALLFWMLVAVCSIIINPHIVMKGGGYAWMQRGLMLFLGLIMTAHVMSYPMHGAMRPYAGMLFYIMFMAISSIQGWNPKISYLKLFLFFLIYFAYFGVSNQVGINPQVSSRKIRSVMLSIAILFIFGSIALVPFPGLSQLKASDFEAGKVDLSNFTSLFMGMTNHSQCLGPVVSAASVVLLGDFLFSIKKVDLLYMCMLLCCPYLVYLTSSRTGMGSFILGQLFVLWVFMNAHGLGSRWKSKVMTIAMMLLTLLLVAVTCMPSLQSKALKFATKFEKRDSKNMSTEAIISSRRGLMDAALYNFKKSPLLGNGFQVSAEMKNRKEKGLAVLSAPIEKGVWVVAILEEGGIFGFAIFAIFLVVSGWNLLMRRCYLSLSLFFTIIVSNMAEFTMFSMSGMGGFMWGMVFIGAAFDAIRIKQETLNGFSVPREW